MIFSMKWMDFIMHRSIVDFIPEKRETNESLGMEKSSSSSDRSIDQSVVDPS